MATFRVFFFFLIFLLEVQWSNSPSTGTGAISASGYKPKTCFLEICRVYGHLNPLWVEMDFLDGDEETNTKEEDRTRLRMIQNGRCLDAFRPSPFSNSFPVLFACLSSSRGRRQLLPDVCCQNLFLKRLKTNRQKRQDWVSSNGAAFLPLYSLWYPQSSESLISFKTALLSNDTEGKIKKPSFTLSINSVDR